MMTYKDFLKINKTWVSVLYDTVIDSYITSLDIFTYNDPPKPKSDEPSTHQHEYVKPDKVKKTTRDSTIEDLFDGIDGDWRNDDED